MQLCPLCISIAVISCICSAPPPPPPRCPPCRPWPRTKPENFRFLFLTDTHLQPELDAIHGTDMAFRKRARSPPTSSSRAATTSSTPSASPRPAPPSSSTSTRRPSRISASRSTTPLATTTASASIPPAAPAPPTPTTARRCSPTGSAHLLLLRPQGSPLHHPRLDRHHRRPRLRGPHRRRSARLAGQGSRAPRSLGCPSSSPPTFRWSPPSPPTPHPRRRPRTATASSTVPRRSSSSRATTSSAYCKAIPT